jgi:hypothetical protein
MSDDTAVLFPTVDDMQRAEHSALRHRMTHGTWSTDLEEALRAHVSLERRQAWGVQDMTSNVFKSVTSQVGGVPYDSAPTITGPQGAEDLTQVGGLLDKSGVWQLQQRTCEDLVATREMFVRASYDEAGGLVFTPYAPHLVYAEASPLAPDRPRKVALLDERELPDGTEMWTWEEWNLDDDGAPSWGIYSASDGKREDLTKLYSTAPSAQRGKDYGWMVGQDPYIPGVLYHAAKTGRLWDPWYGIEAVAGSLTLAVLNTFWVHCLRDASFLTVLLVGGVPAGIKVSNRNGQTYHYLPLEPGTINLVERQPKFEGQVTAIQLQPGSDPLKLIEAIQVFEGRVAVYAGVQHSDITRTSGDPRSGVALAISQHGLRSAQRRIEPQLRRGDTELIEVGAKLCVQNGRPYPLSGYSISYTSLPLSPEEITARDASIQRRLSLGLLTEVDALREYHPEWSDARLVKYLATAKAERSARASMNLSF